MKKNFVILLGFSLFLTLPSLTSAEEIQKNMGIKLKRGAINLVTAPLEIPKQTKIYYDKGIQKTKNVVPWLFCGVVKGLA